MSELKLVGKDLRWRHTRYLSLMDGMNEQGWYKNYAALDTQALNYAMRPTLTKYERLPEEIRSIPNLDERRRRAEKFVELIVRISQ